MQDDEVRFSVFDVVRHPAESDACFMIEAIKAIVFSQSGLTDPLETSLVQKDKEELGEEAEEYVKWMDSFQPNRRKYYKLLGENTQTLVPSIERPPQLEKKPLPSHLRYAYLGESSTLPIIISADLTVVEEKKLLRVLRDHKDAIGWSLADLKGIRPSMCMHEILLEDGHKPSVEAQRRLNLTMKEVVRCMSDLFHLKQFVGKPNTGCSKQGRDHSDKDKEYRTASFSNSYEVENLH